MSAVPPKDTPEYIEHRRAIVRRSQRKRRDNLREARKEIHSPAGVRAERLRKKAELVAYRGGKCTTCPFTPRDEWEAAALDFHHRDPREKRFSLGGNLMRSMESLKAEADKCDLMCANCHRICEVQNPPAHKKPVGRPRGYTRP